MILVDTSIWVDHLKGKGSALARLLEAGDVLGHPWVVGELALGQLSPRHEVIDLLSRLPQAVVATTDEVLTFVENHHLFGRGIGYVDAQLLASTRLTPDAALWTKDEQLADAAKRLDCCVEPGPAE